MLCFNCARHNEETASKVLLWQQGFSQKGVQLSYGRPFWKKYKKNSFNLSYHVKGKPGGVLPRILGRGVPRRFVNPDPI